MNDPPGSNPIQLPTNAKLSRRKAVWDALLVRDCDFYPLRIEKSDGLYEYLTSTMEVKAVLEEMKIETSGWSRLENIDDLNAAIELAKYSLEQVKAQTEYQDEKATRLLTITTFLSALSGALFSQLEDSYPIATITHAPPFIVVALVVAYAVFLISIFTSLLGALVVFHATQTRFRYPEGQTKDDLEKDPRSLLFFLGLVRSRPKAWVNGWVK